MKKYLVIAPVGENIENLYVGLREFPSERIILLTPEKHLTKARSVAQDLERFKIKAKIEEITGHSWEGIFQKIAEIKDIEKDHEIIINTSTGDSITQCAGTSAAFVNGLKAIAISGNDIMLLPVMKFSYYKLLTDKKMMLLKILASEKCCGSLEELSKELGMSLPLISYHINGNLKSEGLKDLGLVETEENKGRVQVRLTLLGKMLVKGYIPTD